MFPVKRFPAAKREEERVRYERFARFGGGGSGCLRATGGENCDCSDGSIRPGIGLTGSEFSALVSTLPHPPDRFLCFPAHGENEEKFFVSLSNGRVYVYDGSQDEFVEAYCQLDPPMCWTIVRNGEGEPEIAVGDGLDIWRYDRETGFFVRQYEFIPSALCFFGERLFAAEGERVHYSAPLAPFDFAESADEGGYVDFPSDDGGILALSALADGVYAFRARSVFRLKADGAGRDFASEKIGYGGGEIYGVSEGLPDGKIYLLSSDGLYAFDGKKFSAVCPAAPLSPFPGEARFGRIGGKTAFAYVSDEAGGKRVFVFDEGAGEGYFSSLPADGFSGTGGGVFCVAEGSVAEVAAGGTLPEGEEFVFVAEHLDFGAGGRKFWKELDLRGEGSCTAEIGNENGEKRMFSFDLQSGCARVLPLLPGREFSLRISLSPGAAVTEAEAVFLTSSDK